MSAKVFQNIITQMKGMTDRNIGIVDNNAYIIASSDLASIGSRLDDFRQLKINEQDRFYVSKEYIYFPLFSENGHFEFTAFINGTDSSSKSICGIASVAFNEAKNSYEEKHNKAAFVKNILSDNILPGDVYVRAKELNFATDEPRTVLLVRQLDNADVAASELISKNFQQKSSDFVINMNESDIVIVKKLGKNEDADSIYVYAQKIRETMLKELNINTVIGISTDAHHLRELADRYKESQVAIDVGKIFESDKSIIRYERLGLGRIIYQLPTTLCEMFLNEVFKKNPIETLDDDTIETINKFFENNLNVSETSRKLYVHRNTLVYRLEKIKKITGLDLREFDHAIVFKVAMMVKMYLDSLNISY